MKYVKKKKSSLIWILIPAAVLMLAVVLLVVALSGGDSVQDPTDPSGATGTTETAPQTTDPSAATDATGDAAEETNPSDGTEAAPTEDTQPTGTTEQTDTTNPTSGKETEPTDAPGTEKEDQTTLKTPYCTLQYPKEWGDFLRVEVKEGNPYTLTYFADLNSGKTQELFTISFGGSQEGALGTVTAGGKAVPLHVSSVDFQPDGSWSDEEINIVYTMQEAMNDLLDAMPIETASQPPQGDPNLPKEDGEEMIIDTPYGELRYPSRWKDYLDLKVNDKNGYSVEFRCSVGGHAPVSLFVVHYGGSKGIAVATGKDSSGKSVEIRLEVLEIDLNDAWSDEDMRIVAAMQEDLNFLLSKLS